MTERVLLTGSTMERIAKIKPFIGSARVRVTALPDTHSYTDKGPISIVGTVVGISVRWPDRWRQVADLIIDVSGRSRLRSVAIGRITSIGAEVDN